MILLLEQKVDNLIIKDFTSLKPNAFVEKTQGNRYQKNGISDYTGSLNGQYIALEAKAGNGHPLSMAQLFFGYTVALSGGLFGVIFPDYHSIYDVPQSTIELSEKAKTAKNASNLSREDYTALENIWKTINAEKKSILFHK